MICSGLPAKFTDVFQCKWKFLFCKKFCLRGYLQQADMCIDSNYININLIINIDIIDGIGLHSLTVSPIQASTRQVCAWDKKRGRTGKTSTIQTPSAEALMCPRPKILLIMQTSSVMNKTSGIISTISWSRGERAFNNIGKKRSEIVFSVESLLG